MKQNPQDKCASLKFASLVVAGTGRVIIPRLELAETFWRRFRGLQLRRSLEPDRGLLLRPCRSVHTHWMRFSVDVVMLDEEGTVLAVHALVKPWRMLWGSPRVQSIVETRGGAISTQVQVGERLEVRYPQS